MEEELGVKVTRLRRRLSVESEGTQSPATPSTPTKKRASKLAKPALELIDENVNENVPKRATRKSIARDVAEPADEKAVTPSRRSTRIRSNTSLVLETLTQSVVESPRARRAIRRTSQLGSDTETATTPARQARRTRKDSASSVEKLAVTNSSEKTTVQVAEAITEEPDKEIDKNYKDNKTDERSPPVRKSPRLNQKSRNGLDEAVKGIHENQTQKVSDGQVQEEPLNTNDDKANNVESVSSEKDNLSNNSANLISEISCSPIKTTILNKTAPAAEDVINENINRKRTKSCTSNQSRDETNLDKNYFVGQIKNSVKKDIMSPKKYINKSDSEFNASGENKENVQLLKSVNFLDATDTIKVLENTSTKDIQSTVFMEDSDSNSGSIGKLTMDIPDDVQVQHSADDQCVPVVEPPQPKRSSASESFSVEPMDIDETIPENVTLNDFSDKTNSSREEDNLRDTSHNQSKRKTSLSKDNSMVMNKSSNKCSPSVTQELQHSKRKSSITPSEENNNKSKVITDEVNKSKRKLSLSKTESENTNHKSSDTEDSYKAIESVNKSKRQSLVSNNEAENSKVKPPDTSQASDNDKMNDSTNKSKRKSSLSNAENDKFKTADVSKAEDPINNSANISKSKAASVSECQTLDNSCNENKSTLVLSQLKDMSANEKISISKSPNDTKNELSKSGIISDKIKKSVKQNLSQDYLTSTPLQQRNMQKLAMAINTSIIGPESKNASKVDLTPDKGASKVAEESDTSDNDSDENSENKSKIIDDEASQASDDYESGDSRNEEEREYERQHDISEKGVTLESEEDVSNDTDYEKDSFIVSSNEEDDNLLSGSGDDLSLSDNELKMTAKSKKKYDGRKRKEQKKASKEMYEARHKINESDKGSKSTPKIYKRQRLESSLQESEKEDSLPKTKNHSRIDSSLDMTADCSNVDESIHVKKKKIKRLSSFCDDITEPNEKEIAVNDQNVSDNNDPLSVAIKLEPKTPQKDISISAIQISHDIENVHLDSNVSLIKPNETSDPLQVTSVNDYEDSDSDISENLEIKSSYDSVLENLNKNNKQKKIKTLDASLNVNKKLKQKTKEPIVDQLNLTQTKVSKKKKTQKTQEYETTVEAPKTRDVASKSSDIDGGDISDSIDMRLLFPEDSNDSEVNASTFKTNPTTDANQTEKFIPLKKTEARTNIRESMEANVSKNESELKINKKKNRKSSENMPESTGEPVETNFSFFIDTKGTYDDADTSTQNSTRKNKKQKQTITEVMQNESEADTADATNPENVLLDISIMSDKKKKKHKKNDTSMNIEQDTTLDVSQNEKKKSRKTSESAVENKTIDNTNEDKTQPEHELLDVSIMSDKKKKKHKNNDMSTNMEQESLLNISLSGVKKPKKTSESAMENNKTDSTNPDNANLTNISELIPQEDPIKSEKKKKKNKHLDMSTNIDETSEAPSMPQSGKKKSKKTSESVMENNEMDKSCTEITQENSIKKKKKNKMEISTNIEEVSEELSISQSGKKKSKKSSESATETDITVADTTIAEVSLNVSLKSDKKKKKNKDNSISKEQIIVESASNNQSSSENLVSEVVTENETPNNDKKKKKKNKSVDLSETVSEFTTENETLNNDTKKKNKSGDLSQIVSEVTTENKTPNTDKKKKKKKNISADVSQTVSEVTTENETPNNDKKKKKKKNKSADVSQNVSEVTTENETPNNDKKNKSADVSQTETVTGGADTGSGKKKRNKKKNKDMHQSEADNQNAAEAIPKKRKRDSPSHPTVDAIDEVKISIKQKKRKMSQNNEKVSQNDDEDAPTEERISYIGEVQPIDIKIPDKKTKKKSKNKPAAQLQATSQDDSKKKNKKRKATDDNDEQKKSKVFKENLLDEVHVPRLPESIINQLVDKPNKSEKQKKIKAISTAPFLVEEAQKRKNKPSNYLEQSIYLNDDTPVKENQKPQKFKNPKVLPFVPTAITSGKGYTSNFKINFLPQDTEFVAQASGSTNFKNDYLSNQRVKKFRTFEQFKKQRSHKISKF